MAIINKFNSDTTVYSLSFLEPLEVMQSARVCKIWHRDFPKNEAFWIQQCLYQNVPPDSTGAVAYGLRMLIGRVFAKEGTDPDDCPRSWTLVKLIAEYAPDCMHQVKATILAAKIECYRDDWSVMTRSKQTDCLAKRWGVDVDEPFISVRTPAETTEEIAQWKMRTFKAKYPRKDVLHCQQDLEDYLDYWGKTPAKIPTPKPIEALPGNIPLRCFYWRAGILKQAGDPVLLTLDGRKVVLLCWHEEETCPANPPVLCRTFRQGANQRIEMGLDGQQVSHADMNVMQNLIKTSPKWLSRE